MSQPQQFRVVVQEGVCVVTWNPGAVVTVRDAEQALAAEAAAIAGRRMPLLVKLAGVRTMDRAARRTFGSASADMGVTAVALLATSPTQRVLANFFMNLTAPPVPVRMFTDEAKAWRWLRTHREGPLLD